MAAALAARVRGRPGRGQRVRHDRRGRGHREGHGRAGRAGGHAGRRSPRWSSGACWPTCRDAFAGRAARAGRPGRARRRRRPPDGARCRALARTLRYGDVRGTDVARAAARSPTAWWSGSASGCPAAVAALDDDAAAAQMRDAHRRACTRPLAAARRRRGADRGVARRRWSGSAARDDLHGLLAGRLTRLLLDAGRLDADEVGRRMGLVLTVGVPPARAAAWVEGFLAGGGLLLVHDDALLALVDGWLAGDPGGRVRRRAAAAAAHVRRRSPAPSGGRSASGCARWTRRAAPRRGRPSDARPRAGRAGAADAAPAARPRRPAGACDVGPVTMSGCGGGGWCSAGRRRRRHRADARPGATRSVDAALAALYDAGEPDGGRAPPAPRRARRVGPEVARWLGDIRTLLPVHRRAGHAGRRDRAARPDPAAAGAGDARGGRAGRPPGRHAAVAQPGDARADQADGPRGGPRRWSPSWSGGSPRRPGRRSPARSTGPPGSTGPRHRDIDWDRTIRANLKHYQPELRTIVPERLVGYGRRTQRGAARRRPVRRPVRLDGRLGGLLRSVRRGARVDAVAAHLAGRLRHRGGRPDRAAARPGRGAVRHPARRRHRHQPGDRLLPGADHPAPGHASSC